MGVLVFYYVPQKLAEGTIKLFFLYKLRSWNWTLVCAEFVPRGCYLLIGPGCKHFHKSKLCCHCQLTALCSFASIAACRNILLAYGISVFGIRTALCLANYHVMMILFEILPWSNKCGRCVSPLVQVMLFVIGRTHWAWLIAKKQKKSHFVLRNICLCDGLLVETGSEPACSWWSISLKLTRVCLFVCVRCAVFMNN